MQSGPPAACCAHRTQNHRCLRHCPSLWPSVEARRVRHVTTTHLKMKGLGWVCAPTLLHRWDRVFTRSSLALVGVLSVVLGLAAAYGFALLTGNPFTQLQEVRRRCRTFTLLMSENSRISITPMILISHDPSAGFAL